MSDDNASMNVISIAHVISKRKAKSMVVAIIAFARAVRDAHEAGLDMTAIRKLMLEGARSLSDPKKVEQILAVLNDKEK